MSGSFKKLPSFTNRLNQRAIDFKVLSIILLIKCFAKGKAEW